jgi:2-(1,2-epoxy-1,2-dihydrophenyl)acetyl-CoA isomerase
MSEGTVLIENQGDGVVFVILDKPGSMNAIDPLMMDQLVDCLHQLEKDDEVNVIILKGNGKHFSTGGDLSNVNLEDIRELRHMMKRYSRATLTIQQIEKPVIAMVRGYSIGGAMSLVLACDVIFASENAQFSSGFLKMGLTPEMGAFVLMPLAIGLYRAKELWFTGRMVTASEGYTMGFVNRVLPDEEIEEATIAFAREIAQGPQLPVRVTKHITNSILFNSLNTVLASESLFSAFFLATEDHKEIIEAFRKKR